MSEQLEDNDNFEIWEKLVRTAESLEGGINRNSSPQAITGVRNVYDRFLAKFPLFFGYWKKYADLEFSIAGTEAAEMVSRRGNQEAKLIVLGLRARDCKHHKLCRSMDELLLLQG
jgi:pre-mRNA-processing factor 39